MKALDSVESRAKRVGYRGFSPCRLCERDNGNSAFRVADWEWPEGFRHYLADHDIRPSQSFEEFVLNEVGKSRISNT